MKAPRHLEGTSNVALPEQVQSFLTGILPYLLRLCQPTIMGRHVRSRPLPFVRLRGCIPVTVRLPHKFGSVLQK
jgi:hypothetical protein